MSALAKVLYALLLLVHVVPGPKGREESPAELDARLQQIATDAADVAELVDEEHPEQVTRDALLILSTAHHESGFAVDVDKGPCRPGTCPDSAACMLQIVTATKADRVRLFADRRYCFERGLRALKHARLAACPSEELQFAAYAGGDCERGARGSRELYRYWLGWIASYAALERRAKR